MLIDEKIGDNTGSGEIITPNVPTGSMADAVQILQKERNQYIFNVHDAIFNIPNGRRKMKPVQTIFDLQSPLLQAQASFHHSQMESMKMFGGDYWKEAAYSRQIIPPIMQSKKVIYGSQ
jgi:hypothetical protein